MSFFIVSSSSTVSALPLALMRTGSTRSSAPAPSTM